MTKKYKFNDIVDEINSFNTIADAIASAIVRLKIKDNGQNAVVCKRDKQNTTTVDFVDPPNSSTLPTLPFVSTPSFSASPTLPFVSTPSISASSALTSNQSKVNTTGLMKTGEHSEEDLIIKNEV
jgi:hypothetical protein